MSDCGHGTAFGLMAIWMVTSPGTLYWLFFGFEFLLVLLTWWQLRLRWASEQHRMYALASVSLLTVALMFVLVRTIRGQTELTPICSL